MISRRKILGSAAVLAGASAVSGRLQAASIPEAPTTTTNTTQPPLMPTSGPDYQPVVTLNGWTLPWTRQRRVWSSTSTSVTPDARPTGRVGGVPVKVTATRWMGGLSDMVRR